MMSKSINLVIALLCCLTTVFSQQQVAVNSAPAPEGYDVELEVVSEDIGMLVVPRYYGFDGIQLLPPLRHHGEYG